jgi:2'-5' RNA ligase
MEQQLSFFGQEEPARHKYSLFAAFLPGEPSVRLISDFREWVERQHGPLAKPVSPEQFHMTLVAINDYYDEIPQGDIRRASAACEAAAQVASFPISLDHLQSWGTTLVIQGIKSPKLADFQASLLKKCLLQGFHCKKAFTPHVTLSRDSKEILRQPIEPITWEATEVVLIQSVIGEGRHIHLGRWPLSGAS